MLITDFEYTQMKTGRSERLSTFLWFGLGFGPPLLVLSLLSGATQRWITRLFARHARVINLVGGLLLVGHRRVRFVGQPGAAADVLRSLELASWPDENQPDGKYAARLIDVRIA